MLTTEMQKHVDAFKTMPSGKQAQYLQDNYRNSIVVIEQIVENMAALNEMAQHFQDMQRVHGFLLSNDLIEVFRQFTTASNAMATAWAKNNAIMQRTYQLHVINTQQHPHFNL